jgi:hypothetical protein
MTKYSELPTWGWRSFRLYLLVQVHFNDVLLHHAACLIDELATRWSSEDCDF